MKIHIPKQQREREDYKEDFNLSNYLGLNFVTIVIIQIVFYVIGVFFLKWFYNNSLPTINSNFKTMGLGTAIFFSLFLIAAGMYFN